jgi:hypothetical protein
MVEAPRRSFLSPFQRPTGGTRKPRTHACQWRVPSSPNKLTTVIVPRPAVVDGPARPAARCCRRRRHSLPSAAGALPLSRPHRVTMKDDRGLGKRGCCGLVAAPEAVLAPRDHTAV